MKKKITGKAKGLFNRTALLFTTLLLSCYGFAQDKKIDVNINTKPEDGNSFFMQPWVWVVGSAIFILLLIALLRSNNSKK